MAASKRRGAGGAPPDAAVPLTARTRAGVTALFGALPVAEPGVVPVATWRPGRADYPALPADFHVGLARILAGRR